MDIQKVLIDIEEKLKQGVKDGVFPGANFSLIYKGKSYYGSVGCKALIPKEETNALDTIYDLASLTKPLATTMAIMKLIDMGKINLTDRVKDYLPYIKYEDVTIKQLLTHSSGYPALTEGTEDMTRKEPLIYDLENCMREYEPDSKVIYSDVGFMYLGFIVEKLTGSMPKFLNEHFYKPLKMKDTMFNHKEILRIAPTEIFKFRGLIRGFVHDEKGFLLDGVAGHAGLYSTVEDLSKMMKMLLNKGSYDGRTYLSEKTFDLISTSVIKVDHEDFRTVGWIRRDRYQNSFICHTGFTGTSMLIDVENALGFTLLSNRVHPTRENKKIIPFRREVETIVYRLVNGES